MELLFIFTDDQLIGKYNVLKDPLIERQGLLPLIRTVYEEGQTINFTCDWDGNDIPTINLKGSNHVSIQATMFPIHNPAGELTNVINNWIDVTDHKKAEKEILKLNRDLEQKVKTRILDLKNALKDATKANNAKSNFLAGMSHELLTPLNAIIGFPGILENQHFGKLNKKQINYVNDILESGKHLLSLINDILDLSKVEAGKMVLKPEFLNINDLVENSLLMIREKALKHGIELQFTGDEKLTAAKIYADEQKLKQVLYNLNSNAVKFTRDGGKISLSTHYILNYGELKESFKILVNNEQDAFPAVVICVKGTGSGVPFELTQNIFEKFFQASQGYSDKTPGTGLGIPLTKKFVQMHKGKIWVESEGKDKNSRFFVFLPVKIQEKSTRG
ncbi:MAG: HAMP domain-containing histidine kinase [Desulfobacula sp.]|jgi:signal transduction histidine kinase|nr:HAMP domain-containing histidine kinase [Desulfobacula sp.]MBT3485101.1 HAMP domain-containing histidine kinase [Desulfobacula sp.]MBT3804595.1 HAMP domain-containing histidine kinase [Desulfobacula sp.]MBT4025112.1 HAMP domain-containing histidine kinase [Desulfobacula sp.]MBT4198265.1 HAMP domain-containing histidine kinase [Desulfobacula sp.]